MEFLDRLPTEMRAEVVLVQHNIRRWRPIDIKPSLLAWTALSEASETLKVKAKTARYVPSPCPKCGKKSKVTTKRKDYRDVMCTACDHGWQESIE